MGDYQPVNPADASPMTKTAGAAITGGQLLFVSGDEAVTPTAGTATRAIGVAAHDAPSGGRVTVWTLPGVIHETTNVNAGTIAAGAPIIGGASGGADTGTLATVAAAGTLVGIATKGAATTAKVRWIGV